MNPGPRPLRTSSRIDRDHELTTELTEFAEFAGKLDAVGLPTASRLCRHAQCRMNDRMVGLFIHSALDVLARPLRSPASSAGPFVCFVAS